MVTLGKRGPTMWGLSSRGFGLGDRRRVGRVFELGLMRVVVRGPVEHTIVELAGELDFTCASELRRRVGEMPHHIAAIDLSQLDFIDGEGVVAVQALVRDRSSADSNPPLLTGMKSAVARTFALVAQRDAHAMERPELIDR